MRAKEFVSEKWSRKYKSSINCANPKGFSQRAHCQGRKKNEDLDEFAPPGGDDRDPNEEEILHRLAAQWWQGDEDPRAERTLATMGWEIGQDEGYDNGGAFVVRAGDINGNSFISWPSEELESHQLDELMFKGSECTKDCSGHRAGYNWSIRKGLRHGNSPYSPSFNKGAALAVAGL